MDSAFPANSNFISKRHCKSARSVADKSVLVRHRQNQRLKNLILNIVHKYIRIYLYSADPIVKRKAKNSSKSSKTKSPTPSPPSSRPNCEPSSVLPHPSSTPKVVVKKSAQKMLKTRLFFAKKCKKS